MRALAVAKLLLGEDIAFDFKQNAQPYDVKDITAVYKGEGFTTLNSNMLFKDYQLFLIISISSIECFISLNGILCFFK